MVTDRGSGDGGGSAAPFGWVWRMRAGGAGGELVGEAKCPKYQACGCSMGALGFCPTGALARTGAFQWAVTLC